ncbi:hypothetical protein ACFO3Q_10640 [Coralloluteibacterium thermophilus]|uniref:Uncharacterized protein n=2 Tax=Coralloluteibacterium thermophilum TaxID=2707049 RepID=A0ABV9NMC0_9GAMM
MHLVQILLPRTDPEGRPFPPALFAEIRERLAARFGGVTAHTRAPAQGLWDGDEGRERDDILLHEVMVEALDRAWWADFRRELETRFAQDEIVVRALPAERL